MDSGSPPDISSNESTPSFMNDALLYKSKRTAKSLWQQYRIYRDRIELQSWILLHTIVVPVNEIQAVEIRPPVVLADVFRGKGFFFAFWAFKIDNADCCRHVAIEKKSGLMKRIRFSPDDPEKFVAMCKSILPNG
jgi:hypothetical protein